MSNRCPHCGAPAGRAHEPCPYAPGGKFYKGPKSRRPALDVAEVKAVSAALAHGRPTTEEVAPSAEEVDGIAPSHPDCKRCAQVRQKTLARVKKAREKKASK